MSGYLPEEVGNDSYCFKEECACTDKIYTEKVAFLAKLTYCMQMIVALYIIYYDANNAQ